MYKKLYMPSHLQNAYDSHLLIERKGITRFFCLLALGFTISSAFVDFWALPSTIYEANVVRAILLVVEVCVLWAIYQPKLTRYHSHFQHVLSLGPALGIIYVLYVSNPSETGHYIYATFLVMIIMLFFSWSTLSTRALIINTGLIILSYTVSTFAFLAPNADILQCLSCYIPTVFAMLGAAIAGYFGKTINENNSRQNFLSKYSLNQSLKAQKYYADHDTLTGLSNRRDAERFFDEDISYAKEHKAMHLVMLLDLNGFKAINDDHGHNAGDNVLKVVAKRIKNCIRENDSISRIGGDEFAISVVLSKSDNNYIKEIVNKIQQSVIQPIKIDDATKVSVGTSIGVASYPRDADTFEELLKIADRRMYANKRMKSTRNKSRRSTPDTRHTVDSKGSNVIQMPLGSLTV